MLTGLAGGALWALDTVILGMALALPVFTGDPRAAILAPFASTFLHDLCSSLWMLSYTGLRRQYKAVWQALRTRGGRFVALGALLGVHRHHLRTVPGTGHGAGTLFLKGKIAPYRPDRSGAEYWRGDRFGLYPWCGAAKGTSTGLWLRAAVLYRLGSRGGHLHLRTAKQHRHHRPVRPVRHRLLSVLLQGAGQAGHRQGHAPEHYLRCLVAAVLLPAFAPGTRHQGHTLRPGSAPWCAAGRLRKTRKIGKIKQPMSAKNGHTKTEGGFQYARFISFNAGNEPIL